MQSDEQKTTIPRIRELVFEPLEELGLTRPKDMKVDQWDKAQKSICKNLAYMDQEAMLRLKLFIKANLEGPNKNRWPSPAAIYKWAGDIQPDTREELDLVVSWLQSKEGPIAIDGGYIVELRNDLRKFRRPPDEYGLRAIKSRSEQNRYKIGLINERKAVDKASDDELRWLDGYMRVLQRCKDIVAAKGIKQREAS